ncbi:MAG: holo-ACP synthase [Firmicutes bacterium]|jgi:holo-[acyl-carrier protein] synthase|nr:holo-ACP synthase [Bacillota bacterium]
MSARLLGIGLDVVDVERIAGVLARRGARFLERVLTPQERIDVGDPPRATSVAARFAAKEAVAKAFGTGVRGFSLRDIEVHRDERGCPAIRLHGGAAQVAAALGVARVWISLSHEKTVAVSVAVLEGDVPCSS